MSRYWTRRARIDLVPLIDVLVNLLFFFLIYGAFDNGSAALPVNLPNSRTAVAVQSQPFIIAIDSEGQYSVDGKAVAQQDIPRQIAAELSRNPDVQVVLFPDASVPYDQIVVALDLIREGGVDKPALGVRRKSEPDEVR